MSKLSLLKLLPAALGWLLFFIAAAFILAMCIPSARAAEPASTPNALTCAPHKTLLGLHDGWNCTSTGVSDLTISTPKGTLFQFW